MEMKNLTELEDGKEEVVAVEVPDVVDSVARGEVDADCEEVTAATVVTEVLTEVIEESIMSVTGPKEKVRIEETVVDLEEMDLYHPVTESTGEAHKAVWV